MVLPLFIVPMTTLWVVSCLVVIAWLDNTYNGKTRMVFGTSLISLVKLVTLLSLNVSLGYGAILWKAYPMYKMQNGVQVSCYPSSAWFELQHNLGLPFLLLSTFILIIALLAAWYSLINMPLFVSLLLIIELCLVGAFSCTNLFVFLLLFEASALPVFILIVYCGNSRRERLKASYYFFFFTLYGSISLMLLILNLYSLNQIIFVSGSFSGQQTSHTAWVLLFLAFAVKIPLFPFHVWLPYAHVEASTSASIILAALMLKLGGYGVLKFMLPLFTIETHLFFRPAVLTICIMGLIYGGLLSLRQLDLKRQLAFSSISHMSFAMAGIFTFTEAGCKGAVYLMLSHGLTSAALFFLVGALSERYHTRSVVIFSGLFSVMPMFAGFFIFATLANIGFPGTSGFLPEFFILVAVVQIAPLTLLPFLLGLFLTTAGSLIMVLKLLFGHVKTSVVSGGFSDITKLEFIVMASLTLWMLVLGLYDVLLTV